MCSRSYIINIIIFCDFEKVFSSLPSIDDSSYLTALKYLNWNNLYPIIMSSAKISKQIPNRLLLIYNRCRSSETFLEKGRRTLCQHFITTSTIINIIIPSIYSIMQCKLIIILFNDKLFMHSNRDCKRIKTKK